MWARCIYRVAQFLHVIYAAHRPVDETYVRRLLARFDRAEALEHLFHRMSYAEQHHGVRVCRVLERDGFDDPDLLLAALLHDVGKSVAPPRLWERVFVVLVEHFAPRLAIRWSECKGDDVGCWNKTNLKGWRRGFIVRRYHGEWGAKLASEAGAPPRVVDLIRRHHIPSKGDELLAALQRADET